MSQLISVNQFGVTEKNGIPVVSSRKVAEVFGKRHDNVLRDIENILSTELNSEPSEKTTELNFEVSRIFTAPQNGVSKDFRAGNFVKSTYKDSTGRKLPEYLMTKDGFTLLAMGFTGRKALKFKIAYIQRFNEMEQFIASLLTAKLEFPDFTAAIMEAHEEPKHYHFSNEINMINRIVLGMTASEFRKKHNLGKVASIRPYLTTEQIKAIETLQRADIGLIISKPDFQERKQALQGYYEKRFGQVLLAQKIS